MATDAVSPSRSDNCASTLTSTAGEAGSSATSAAGAGALALGPNDGSIRDGADGACSMDDDDAGDRGAKNGSLPNSDAAGFCGDVLRYGSGDGAYDGDGVDVESLLRRANAANGSRSAVRAAC